MRLSKMLALLAAAQLTLVTPAIAASPVGSPAVSETRAGSQVANESDLTGISLLIFILGGIAVAVTVAVVVDDDGRSP